MLGSAAQNSTYLNNHILFGNCTSGICYCEKMKHENYLIHNNLPMTGFKSTINLLLNRSQSSPTKRPSANSCEADSYEAAQSTAIHCFPLYYHLPWELIAELLLWPKQVLFDNTVTVTGLQWFLARNSSWYRILWVFHDGSWVVVRGLLLWMSIMKSLTEG